MSNIKILQHFNKSSYKKPFALESAPIFVACIQTIIKRVYYYVRRDRNRGFHLLLINLFKQIGENLFLRKYIILKLLHFESSGLYIQKYKFPSAEIKTG